MQKKIEGLNIYQKIGVLSQLLLTFFILLFLFISIGEPFIIDVVNVLVIILFLVMGYNNHILYKRKRFTIFNILIALLLLIEMLFL